MFFAIKDDEEPFKKFSTELNLVVQRLVRFGVHAIQAYFGRRGDLMQIEDLLGPDKG